MGCVFGVLSYVLTQFFCAAERLVTVSLCGIMACAVFLTLVLAIVFGIALGYHYSMAEEMLHNQTLTIKDVSLTRRQGDESVKSANPQPVRLTGENEPARPLRVMTAHSHEPDIARALPPPPPPLPPPPLPLRPPPRIPEQPFHVPLDFTENPETKLTSEAATSHVTVKIAMMASTTTEKTLLDDEKKPAWWPTEGETWLTDSEPISTSPNRNVFFQDESSAPALEENPEYEEYQGPLVRRRRNLKTFVFH